MYQFHDVVYNMVDIWMIHAFNMGRYLDVVTVIIQSDHRVFPDWDELD